MRSADGKFWPHFPTPVPIRVSVCARRPIDRKTLRHLALFFGVPALLFIALKLAAVQFAAAKRGPAVPDRTGSIDVTNWSRLDPAYRAYKVTIGDDSGLTLNNEPARLYGFDVIPRSKTCAYANGDRWACGQRAYIALISAMASTTIDCRETDREAPIDADGRQTFICHLGTDLAELMLRQGWGTVQKGVGEPRYVAAAETARMRQAGMWRPLPSSP